MPGHGGEPMVISKGTMASASYTKKKGVSPMAQLGDVQLALNTHGNSSIHLAPRFFMQSWVHVLSPLSISAFALLTCPLLSGCAIDV
jgi:hypothetical protein